MARNALLFLLLTGLTACDAFGDRSVPDLPAIQAKLAFTCTHEAERLPPLPPEADVLFTYARWLQRENLVKEDPAVEREVGRLYRIAAAQGHHKALFNLINGISGGKFDGTVEEMLDFNDALLKAGVPMAYYNLGHFLENGMGVKEDPELALKYFRKAADLGNPHAQYYVAEKLAPIDIAPDIARQMRRCAAEQGHGKAALALGINLKNRKNYKEAVEAFQLGVKAGNENAASFLENGFKAPPPSDDLYYLDLPKDDERSRRYMEIRRVLHAYSYLNPVVPELDEIVPLPPAKLPPWDGKLQWRTEFQANVPPPKPTDDLIARLAHDKGLDPASGMPVRKR
jgi:tetratricopeptide (TPR) repeat protein